MTTLRRRSLRRHRKRRRCRRRIRTRDRHAAILRFPNSFTIFSIFERVMSVVVLHPLRGIMLCDDFVHALPHIVAHRCISIFGVLTQSPKDSFQRGVKLCAIQNVVIPFIFLSDHGRGTVSPTTQRLRVSASCMIHYARAHGDFSMTWHSIQNVGSRESPRYCCPAFLVLFFRS